jgi:hypothetical protein
MEQAGNGSVGAAEASSIRPFNPLDAGQDSAPHSTETALNSRERVSPEVVCGFLSVLAEFLKKATVVANRMTISSISDRRGQKRAERPFLHLSRTASVQRIEAFIGTVCLPHRRLSLFTARLRLTRRQGNLGALKRQ